MEFELGVVKCNFDEVSKTELKKRLEKLDLFPRSQPVKRRYEEGDEAQSERQRFRGSELEDGRDSRFSVRMPPGTACDSPSMSIDEAAAEADLFLMKLRPIKKLHDEMVNSLIERFQNLRCY